MSPFLNLVVNDLLNRFNDNLDEATLVFPSRRAGLFFNKYLSEKISKPIWVPQTISISDMMHRISGLRLEESISLIARLYDIYRKVKGADEPFDSFYFWGEVMLADFDQVDKYRVDAEKLYANVKDIKEIEERFGGLTPEQAEVIRNYLGILANSEESQLRDNFLTIWKILGEIYKQFTTELLKNGLCYEGLAYRKASDLLRTSHSSIDIPENIVFIGFNALNACEKELMNYCKRQKKALFYWDYDLTFVDNPIHEAGLFIRENILQFPNALSIESCNENSFEKNVKLIAAPSTVTQAKLIPQILVDIQQHGGSLNESTAIVFPRENLLIPALQSISEDVDQLNITMGYPIKETPAFSLAENLVKLQINKRISTDKKISFYHNDVLSLLNHPYIRICETKESRFLVGEIKRRNLFYPTKELISVTPFLSTIFSVIDNSKDLSYYILNICNFIAQTISKNINDEDDSNFNVDLEFLFALNKSITRLGGILSTLDIEISPRIFLQIFRKVFVQERVSFTGEPLAGLQLMGFLETRALDFENLVILSFNDDVIPGKNHPISFITPSLRIAYGLPDYKHHDAVYAYYFYRLLHRAKNVYLVYSARTEGMSSGERSRFALQLEYEQMVGKVKTIPVGFQIDITPQTPIIVEKSDEVINSLIKNITKEEKGITLSPSGLTAYLTCPLRFYFRYGVGIHEPDEISEEIGAQEFGSIIHKVMEELYKTKVGTTITADEIGLMLKNSKQIENILDSAFCKIFLNDESTKPLESISGRNLLARNAMLFTIKKMLRVDMKRAPFHLLHHEQEFYIQLDVDNSSALNRINLGGYIDRVERIGDSLWIIDYKTGSITDSKGKFYGTSDLFDPKRIDKVKEVLQIFCYSLAAKSIYSDTKVKPGLWFVKSLKPGENPSVSVKAESNRYQVVEDFTPFAEEFASGLKNLVSEIFNTSIPFTQTDKQDRCKTCPYISICGRD